MEEKIKEYRAYCLWLLQDGHGLPLHQLLYHELSEGNEMAFDIIFSEDDNKSDTFDLIKRAAKQINKTYGTSSN
jgi:hypothetical protein